MTVDNLKDAISSRGFCYASKGAEENSPKIYIDLYSGIVTQANKFGNDEITDLSRNGRSNFDWLVWLSAEHDFIFNNLGSLAPYIDQIKQIKNPKPKNESIDVKDLLAQFDLDAIGKSAIKYYQAIIDLSNTLHIHSTIICKNLKHRKPIHSKILQKFRINSEQNILEIQISPTKKIPCSNHNSIFSCSISQSERKMCAIKSRVSNRKPINF